MSDPDSDKRMEIDKLLSIIEGLNSKVEEYSAIKNEPIAVIGMSCRFPGGANSLDEYWHMLMEGTDGISKVPADRWSLDEYYDADRDATNKMYCQWGGFLQDDVYVFDAEFFDLFAVEADSIDPQQRVALEVTWEALENAYIKPETLKETRTGVFFGVSTFDYAEKALREGEISSYTNSGYAHSVLAGRISYILGLQGPSLAVDTACSSSLVALHLACRSLRNHESNLAIAGGVNMMLTPDATIGFCKGEFLAEDGRCKTFDESANGYVRGEGCGVLILKRLADAKKDNDNILAVIKGSAVNQDGASGGLTVPNGPAQEKVIKDALKTFNINPTDINYVEAHGTGTSLGDPIEVNALMNVLRNEQNNQDEIKLGSVKTNIGHLEAAAGMASVIKIILALNHETIPKQLHFNRLNPNILTDIAGKFKILSEHATWPRAEKPRLAGTSGFAFQGTNAHVIIEEAPKKNLDTVTSANYTQFNIFSLSAKNIPALKESVNEYIEIFTKISDENLTHFNNICYTANTSRQLFDNRLSVVFDNKQDLISKLQSWLNNDDNSKVKFSDTNGKLSKKTGFIFNSVEKFDIELYRSLYEEYSTFKENFDMCLSALTKNDSQYNNIKDNIWQNIHSQTDSTFASLKFVCDYSLYKLWASIVPETALVTFRNTGKILAGHIAGMYSLETALSLLKICTQTNSNHSSQLQEYIGQINQSKAKITMLAEDGAVLSGADLKKVAFWQQNDKTLSPDKCIAEISKQRIGVLLEIGDTAKTLPADKPAKTLYVSALNIRQKNKFGILDSLAAIYVSGGNIDWDSLYPQNLFYKEPVPTYKFQRQKHKISGESHVNVTSNTKQQDISHALISSATELAKDNEYLFYGTINPSDTKLLGEHRVYEYAVLPAVAYLETAFKCANLLSPGSKTIKLDDISFERAIAALDTDKVELQLDYNTNGEFSIYSKHKPANGLEQDWNLNVSGNIELNATTKDEINSIDVDEIINSSVRHRTGDDFLKCALDNGMKFGPRFSSLKDIWYREGEALAKIELADEFISELGAYEIYPPVLDSGLQLLIDSLPFKTKGGVAHLPVSIDEATKYEPIDKTSWILVKWQDEEPSDKAHKGDIYLYNSNGNLAVQIKGLTAIEAPRQSVLIDIEQRENAEQSVAKQDVKETQNIVTKTTTAAKSEIVEKILNTAKDQQLKVLQNFLLDSLQKLLGDKVKTTIEISTGFMDIGVDSLLAVEFRKLLKKNFSGFAKIPPTAAFDYPNIGAMSEFILAQIRAHNSNEAETPATQTNSSKITSNKGQQKNEPIAIIGMSCRMPGGANDLDKYWQLLEQGMDAVSIVPEDRWNIDKYYDPNIDAPGKMYTKWGGFLQDIKVDEFDAQFFGITPGEARDMDPQQRMLLEVTWEALEIGGIEPASLNKSKTAVFVGQGTYDYVGVTFKDLRTVSPYTNSGVGSSVAAGRISYTLGLQGPCMTLDTACSSSLIAIHESCMSLRTGESNMAIAGGVNLHLTPDLTIGFCKARMLSVDGKCKTFDASANGYARGEGCGVVILKRLSDAKRDGDRILAVIKGSATNQDGASGGLTVPNGPAQQDVIRRALMQANLKPSDITYVETHGTGTSLGDPIEVQALGQVYNEGRTEDNLLNIASVKTNFGHLETAAGMASIIKVVLSMQNKKIPKHLHFKEINPMINLQDIPATIPTETVAWQPAGGVRVAGMSGFAFQGSNAHVIVEESAATLKEPVHNDRDRHVFSISAKTPQSLHELLEKYSEFLDTTTSIIEDICYTANCGRSHFEYRFSTAVTSLQDLKETIVKRISESDLSTSKEDSIDACKLGIIISPDVISDFKPYKELYATNATFKTALDDLQALISENNFTEYNLLDLLWGDKTDILNNNNKYITIANFVVKYATLQLLVAWGLIPDRIIATGTNLIIAGVAAGVLTIKDALQLLLARYDNKTVDNMTLASASIDIYDGVKNEKVTDSILAFADYWNAVTNTESITIDIDPFDVNESLEYVCIGDDSAITTTKSINAICDKQRSLWCTLTNTIAALYMKNIQINWHGFEKGYTRNKVQLPTYAFQRKSFWVESLGNQDANSMEIIHPLLGAKVEVFDRSNETYYTNKLSLDNVPYLSDHKIYNNVVVPGAALIEMAIFGANELNGKVSTTKEVVLENIVIEAPLILRNSLEIKQDREVQMNVLEETGNYTFKLVSSNPLEYQQNANLQWTTHVSGSVSRNTTEEINSLDLAAIKNRCPSSFKSEDMYMAYKNIGMEYGKNFQGITEIFIGENEFLAKASLAENLKGAEYCIHPTLLDAAFQAMGAMWFAKNIDSTDAYLPFDIAKLVFMRRAAADIFIHVHSFRSIDNKTLRADIDISSDTGEVLLSIKDFSAVKVSKEELKRIIAKQDTTASKDTYSLTWNAIIPEEKQVEINNCLLVGNVTADLENIKANLNKYSELKQVATCSLDNFADYIMKHSLDTIILSLQESGSDVLDDNSTYMQLLKTIQVIMSANNKPANLFVITNQAVWVANEQQSCNLDTATLPGITNVINLELPNLECKLIDLEKNVASIDNINLRQILNDAQNTNILAYRHNTVYAPMIEPYQFKVEDQNQQLDANSSYLIVGGLGDLGLQVLEKLAVMGARNIYLSGRRKPSDNAAAVIDSLKTKYQGLNIYAKQCDVEEITQVKNLLQEINATNAPIKGIIHAAGVLDDGMLNTQDYAKYCKVAGSKIKGAVNLDKIIKEDKLTLDFIIYFSSIAAVTGNPGQANYAAVNSFLGTFAAQQRKYGINARCIYWGPWSEIGMAARLGAGAISQLIQSGVMPLAVSKAMNIFEQYVLTKDAPDLIVIDVNWEKYLAQFASTSLLYKDIVQQSTTKSANIQANKDTELTKKLRAAETKDINGVLQEYVQESIRGILGLNQQDKIANTEEFSSIGLDSLTAVEFRNKIIKDLGGMLGQNLPVNVFFNYANIEKLCNYLQDEIITFEETSNSDSTSGTSSLQAKIVEMIEQDVAIKHRVNQALPIATRNNTSNILLTGASGFLGGYLLEKCLQMTKGNVYCLIRAETKELALEKLLHSLSIHKIDITQEMDRVVVMLGDTAKDKFALNTADYTKLATEIDLILHAAAKVNHIYEYDALRTDNVLCIDKLLELANTSKHKSIHYVSSAPIVYSFDTELIPTTERIYQNLPKVWPYGYLLSKIVAEIKIQNAIAQGFDINIYRPSQILPVAGEFKPERDMFLSYLLGCLQINAFPKSPGYFNLLGVDTVADAIVFLMINDNAYSQVFNIVNENPISWDEIFTWLQSADYKFALYDLQSFINDYMSKLDKSNYLYTFSSNFGEDGEAFLQFMSTLQNIDSENTQLTLHKLGRAGIKYECADFANMMQLIERNRKND